MRWRLCPALPSRGPHTASGAALAVPEWGGGLLPITKAPQASRRVWEEPPPPALIARSPRRSRERRPAAPQRQKAGRHKVRTGTVPACSHTAPATARPSMLCCGGQAQSLFCSAEGNQDEGGKPPPSCPQEPAHRASDQLGRPSRESQNPRDPGSCGTGQGQPRLRASISLLLPGPLDGSWKLLQRWKESLGTRDRLCHCNSSEPLF